MSRKIKLNKDEVIVFMGTMNAMPMMYALELKKLGYQVIYFVDVAKKDTLSRPENHFPEISYPYPEWIVELIQPSQIFLPLFPKFFTWLYERRISQLTNNKIGCFVLNGFFASLAPFFKKHSATISLSHGSDLDVWANNDNIEILAKTFKSRSIFKYIPNIITKRLISKVVNKQFLGYKQSTQVVYFPIGFNKSGDVVINRLISQGVTYTPRYDISFEPLRGESRDFKPLSDKLFIFSGVRFLFKTFPDGNKGYNKGNDIIIEGIAKYFKINKNIQVHFVEKGEDIEAAKELCRSVGLESVVVWHKEMPFRKLLNLYRTSDVCFDQLGDHWIGAIGGYALWLGKPLIANAEPAIRSGTWPADNPVCSAKTAEEVLEWLKFMQNEAFRKNIAKLSKDFSEKYMAPRRALKLMFDI